jgi:hypothetical protein
MGEFERLQNLLLDGERSRQESRLDSRMDAKLRADLELKLQEHVAELPEALPMLLQQAQNDPRLAKALEKPFARSLELIARNQKELLISVLFPLIGPIIRRSIAESLSQIVRNMNRALDHSISPKGLRWRLEAMRTGVPFAQVVLKHTLRYRIDHLLLVNNQGGLLLAHAPNTNAMLADSDAVAAMLSALQDFTRDAVLAKPDEGLQSVAVGEMTLKILRGPFAHLAVAYRGELSEYAQESLNVLVEEVHLHVSDSNQLEDKRPEFLEKLQDWLAANGEELDDSEQPKPAGNQKTMWAAGAVACALLAYLLNFGWQTHRARQLSARFANEPGYIAQAQYDGGFWPARFRLSGARDPLSRAPETVAGQVISSPKLQRYLALEPALMASRLQHVGALPVGVQVQLLGDTLTLSGKVQAEEYARLQRELLPFRALGSINTSALTAPPVLETAKSYALRRKLSAIVLPLPFDVRDSRSQEFLRGAAALQRRGHGHRLQLNIVVNRAASASPSPGDASSELTSSLRVAVAQFAPAVELAFYYQAQDDIAPAFAAVSNINYLETRDE